MLSSKNDGKNEAKSGNGKNGKNLQAHSKEMGITQSQKIILKFCKNQNA